jgi:GAF domain-containing protein
VKPAGESASPSGPPVRATASVVLSLPPDLRSVGQVRARLLPAAIELLHRQASTDLGHDMLDECVRTGERAVVQLLSEEAVVAGGRDEEDLVLLRKVGIGPIVMVPLRSEGKVAGVLSFSNNVGRFISEEDLAAAKSLADEVGNFLAAWARASRNGGTHAGA